MILQFNHVRHRPYPNFTNSSQSPSSTDVPHFSSIILWKASQAFPSYPFPVDSPSLPAPSHRFPQLPYLFWPFPRCTALSSGRSVPKLLVNHRRSLKRSNLQDWDFWKYPVFQIWWPFSTIDHCYFFIEPTRPYLTFRPVALKPITVSSSVLHHRCDINRYIHLIKGWWPLNVKLHNNSKLPYWSRSSTTRFSKWSFTGNSLVLQSALEDFLSTPWISEPSL